MRILVHDGTFSTAQVFIDGVAIPTVSIDIKIREDELVTAVIEVDDVSLDIVAGKTVLTTRPIT